jgi:hypothetical protein
MTTVTGTGVGGTIGGPQTPFAREIEASAWAMVNKAALGLVPDSLEVPFTQLGGHLWKYQTDASRPTLIPLGTVRTSVQKEVLVDESWKPYFEDLVGRLPKEVKDEFLKDLRRPFEGRSPNFAQLENALTWTARGLAWLEKAQKPIDPESPAMDRVKQNQAMPGRALRGAISHSENILGGATAYLNRVGANHPHHDSLRHLAEQSVDLHEDLNNLLEMVKDPSSPPPSAEELTGLSNQAEKLLREYQRVDHGKDLMILSPMLESMAAVASALSLTPASPTLYLGLKLATLGLFSSDSLFGKELQALIKALQSGQGAALLKQVGLAKLQMLLMSLLGSIGGATTLAALLTEFGIGRFPAQSEGDRVAGRKFGLQLMMHLLASSGLIKQINSIIVQVCGGNNRAKEIFGDNMELVNLLLMSLAQAKGDPENATGMLESLKPFFEGKFDKCGAHLEAALAEGDLDGEKANGVQVALQQAKIAFAKDNMKGLLAAASTSLEQVDSSPELLKKDLDLFKEFVQLLKQASTGESDETNAMRTALLSAA